MGRSESTHGPGAQATPEQKILAERSETGCQDVLPGLALPERVGLTFGSSAAVPAAAHGLTPFQNTAGARPA